MFLNYADAAIGLGNIKQTLEIIEGNMLQSQKVKNDINGNFTITSNDKKLKIEGKYSNLIFN